MAAITIRNLSDSSKERLRIQAALNGRSMEAEARAIITAGVSEPRRAQNIGVAFMELGKEFGGLDDLELPSREEPYKRPAVFSEEWEAEETAHKAKQSKKRKSQLSESA